MTAESNFRFRCYRTPDYGVWVHYPWSRRLVHLVREEEFIELRTSRNRYKITAEEQEALAVRAVGIVGLSVGQSAAAPSQFWALA